MAPEHLNGVPLVPSPASSTENVRTAESLGAASGADTKHDRHKPRLRKIDRPDGLSHLTSTDISRTHKTITDRKETLANLLTNMKTFETYLHMCLCYMETEVLKEGYPVLNIHGYRDPATEIPELGKIFPQDDYTTWIYTASRVRETYLLYWMKQPKEYLIETVSNMQNLPLYIRELNELSQIYRYVWRMREKFNDRNFSQVEDSLWHKRETDCKLIVHTLGQIMKEKIQGIADAASIHALESRTLQELHLMQSHLQGPWEELCGFVHPGSSYYRIVFSEGKNWWKPPNYEPPSTNSNAIEIPNGNERFAEAYPKEAATNPTLTALVTIISLLSCIPAALAWMHSTHAKGTISDADFYQAIWGTSLQILGLLTMMIPTVAKAHLARQAWFWTWVLAGASGICSVLATVLYLLLPNEWSGLFAFAGTVLQAVVILQLMYEI